MTDRIWVQVADDGRRVPVEGQRGVYFEHGVKHQVRHTPTIERRLAEKDLVKVDPPAAETAAASAGTPAAELTPAVADKIRAEVLGTGAASLAAALGVTSATTASTASATAGAATEKGA
jgi:hypothetical protein